MSANRRHRRGRVFIGERWRLRRAREAGWFTGRLFIAGFLPWDADGNRR